MDTDNGFLLDFEPTEPETRGFLFLFLLLFWTTGFVFVLLCPDIFDLAFNKAMMFIGKLTGLIESY